MENLRISLKDLTWEEAESSISKAEVVLLPVGSIEQHGPHLPLDHDIRSSLAVCRETAKRMYPKVLVSPAIAFGDSTHWLSYPGTISLSASTLTNLVYDVCKSLSTHGVDTIVIVNGHGANENVLWEASWKVKKDLSITIAYVSYWSLIPEEIANENVETTLPGHADEFETSFALARFPKRVRKKKVRKREKQQLFPEKYTYLGGVYFAHFYTREMMGDFGYLGDPTLGNKKKGEKLFQGAVKGLQEFLNFLTGKEFPNSQYKNKS